MWESFKFELGNLYGFAVWSIQTLVGYVIGMPDALKGALIAASVAIFGAYCALVGVQRTIRANQQNLVTQLEHDQRVRVQQHALNLRERIYLDTAEDLSVALNVISRLQNLNKTPMQVYEPFAARSPRLARMYAAASEEALEKYIVLTRALEEKFLELRLARMDLDAIHAKMLAYWEKRDEQVKTRDALIAALTNEILSGQLPQDRYDKLSKRVDQETEWARSYEEKRAGLEDELRPLHLAFTKRCHAERAALFAKALPLLSQVRRDLGFTFDEAKYAELLKPSERDEEFLNGLFRGKVDPPDPPPAA
ncbi:hypothetical protein [Hydrogenophaga sp.]|uniref:hypothetical protein n=1 Tax=Hydrogenophaga sp. TaxID=1904254 RepID=UPI0027222806|nr:hypothetical protein [Hydrogenophaga sp.]MDO9507627.1 hypothetical protein [Hydrogenophaga sp.]